MKTRTVTLYADLWPNWHEAKESELNVFASTNPEPKSLHEIMRVKITVELPEHRKDQPFDFAVTGKAEVAQ